jgi:hypothetical protein
MSDKSQLMQRAEEVLLDMVNKAAEIGSAAVDEIPLVVQELLTWHFYNSLILWVAGVLFTVLWVTFVVKLWRDGSKLTNNDYRPTQIKRDLWGDEWGWLVFSTTFGSTISFIWLLNQTDWLKILVAPRLYLLEYAAQLIK